MLGNNKIGCVEYTIYDTNYDNIIDNKKKSEGLENCLRIRTKKGKIKQNQKTLELAYILFFN